MNPRNRSSSPAVLSGSAGTLAVVTMVPWSLLAPEQTERIAAVLLGRKHPRAIRVRPSRGDGGIDLRDRTGDGHDDIYQIKSFATPLTDSRKRQIKESLDAVSDNAAVVIRDWYLVVPLNPSAAELDWFQNATASRPFAAYWFGLDRLESLAAEFPDVVDYYVGDGRRRVEQSIEQLRALAGIVPGGNSQLIAPADTTSPLAALYRTLNRDDPHFRYEFEVGAQPPPVQSLTDRRGLIGSFTYGEADVAVTHHVYGKYANATDDRPVPLTFTVCRDQMDEAVTEEWDRALRYGTPVRLPPGVVTVLNFGLPGGLEGGGGSEGSLWMSAASANASHGYPLRLRVEGPDGEPLAEAVLQMDPVTRGLLRAGVRAHGRDVHSTFELEILTDLSDDGTPSNVNVRFTMLDLTGRSPAALRTGVHFLEALHEPNRLAFAPEYGPIAGEPEPLPVSHAPVTDELVTLVDALADLQERAAADLRMPDLKVLTERSYREILRAAQLVRGETLRETWDEHSLTMQQAAPLPDGPVQLALSGSQRFTVGRQEITLEPITTVLLAAESQRDEDDPRRWHVRPALGNDTMLTRLAPIEAMPPQPLDHQNCSE